jgi:hypothetical protein
VVFLFLNYNKRNPLQYIKGQVFITEKLSNVLHIEINQSSLAVLNMCMKCLREGMLLDPSHEKKGKNRAARAKGGLLFDTSRSKKSKKQAEKRKRPQWVPSTNEKWWIENVETGEFCSEDSQIRYCSIQRCTDVHSVVFLPDIGHSFLEHSMFFKKLSEANISVSAFDFPSQGTNIFQHTVHIR